MTIHKTVAGENRILKLEGRLDTTTAPDFQKELLAEMEQKQNIVLNFKELVYVSSAGLRALLTGQKTAKKIGITMTLTEVAPEILEVFKMTGFVSILDIQ